MLSYLNALRGESLTCTVSLPAIASACDISERQAQVNTERLIKAGLLKRTGYDFGNVDRSQRGTKYKLSRTHIKLLSGRETEKLERVVQMLFNRQDAIESRLQQLASKQDELLSLVIHLTGQSVSGEFPKQSAKIKKS